MHAPNTPIPVIPGGRRGMRFAGTRQLVELRTRYRALIAAPTTSPPLRAYARSVLAEIAEELRRRSPKEVVA